MKRFHPTDSIEISPAFVAILCAYYYFDPAGTFAPFVVALLFHEAGHLLLLWLLGAKVHKLHLAASGAVIVTESLSYGQEISVAAAGPVCNLLLFLPNTKTHPVAAFVNLCLLAYNLLPFYPMDGGRILRALLHLLLPERSALWTERGIGIGCGVLLLAGACYLTCVWHAGLWPILIFALLMVRIAGTILPEQSFLPVSS